MVTRFNTSLNGYSKDQVNKFVAEVTREYESMLSNLKTRDLELERLKQELTKYKNMENVLNRALIVAEDAGAQMRKVAKDESRAVIDDARRNASKILNDALLKAQSVENEAIELKRRVIGFKRRFRTAVETELEMIENIDEKI